MRCLADFGAGESRSRITLPGPVLLPAAYLRAFGSLRQMYNMALDCSEEGDLIIEVSYSVVRRSTFDLISGLCLRSDRNACSKLHAQIRSVKPDALGK